MVKRVTTGTQQKAIMKVLGNRSTGRRVTDSSDNPMDTIHCEVLTAISDPSPRTCISHPVYYTGERKRVLKGEYHCEKCD